MFVYDIMKNQVNEMRLDEIAEIVGVTISSISHARSRKAIIKRLNWAIYREEPTLKERREMYAKLTFEDEVWHIIKGSDDRFLISNYGRVKRIYKAGEKFLMPSIRKQCGNMVVKVRFNGVYKSYRVKDLVAAHFLRKPKPGEVLFHSNRIKTDDSAANLKWVDKKKLGQLTGGISKSKEVVQVDPETYEVIAEFRSTRETARMTPYSYQTISNYCNGKNENHYGDLFMWREDYEKAFGDIL